ncbi:MAG: hypothetical protein ACPLX8_01895, partial [Nanopusillaceae archaeon]
KQGDLGRYISLSGKIELTKKLESLFDIEYYSIILKVIEGLLRDLEKEKEYLEREKNSLFKDIITYRELFGNKDISQLLEEAKRYEELKRLREMIYKDYIELKTLENEIDYSLLSQENYLLNKLNELIEKEKILKENIIDLESEKKNLKYEKVSEDLLKDSIDILEKRKAELEIYKNMNEKELEIDIQNAKELLNDLEEISRYYDIESEYQKIKEDIEKIKREKILIDNKNREYEEYIKILEKESKECPVCKRPLTEDIHRKLLEEYKREIERNKEKYKELVIEEENKKKIFDEINRKYERMIYIKKKLESKNINLNNILGEKEKLINVIKEKEEIKRKILEYKTIEDTINYIRRMEIDKVLLGLRKEYENIEKEINDIRKKLSKIEDMKNKLNKINEIYKRHNYSSKKDFEDKIKELDNELNKYSHIKPELIRNYKEKIDRYDNLLKKIKKINDRLNSLRSLYSILIKFIEIKRDKLSKNLSSAFEYYF